jgi:hypothetical protein
MARKKKHISDPEDQKLQVTQEPSSSSVKSQQRKERREKRKQNKTKKPKPQQATQGVPKKAIETLVRETKQYFSAIQQRRQIFHVTGTNLLQLAHKHTFNDDYHYVKHLQGSYFLGKTEHVEIWDFTDMNHPQTINVIRKEWSSIMTCGKFIAGSIGDDTYQFYNWKTGQYAGKLHFEEQYFWADGHTTFDSGHLVKATGRSTRVYDMYAFGTKKSQIVQNINVTTDYHFYVGFTSLDGGLIIRGVMYGIIRLYKFDDNGLLTVYKEFEDNVNNRNCRRAVLIDERHLAVLFALDRTNFGIDVWDLVDGTVVKSAQYQSKHRVRSLLLLASNSLLVEMEDCMKLVIDLESLETKIENFQAPDLEFFDAKHFCSVDDQVSIWALSSEHFYITNYIIDLIPALRKNYYDDVTFVPD